MRASHERLGQLVLGLAADAVELAPRNSQRGKPATLTEAALGDVVQRHQAHLRLPKLEAAAALDGEHVALRGGDQNEVVAAIGEKGARAQEAAGRAVGGAKGERSDPRHLDGTLDALGGGRLDVKLAEAPAKLFSPSLVALPLSLIHI